MRNCTFNISTTIWPPFIVDNSGIVKNLKKGHHQIVNLTDGIEIEIIKTLAKSMNFKPVFMYNKKY